MESSISSDVRGIYQEMTAEPVFLFSNVKFFFAFWETAVSLILMVLLLFTGNKRQLAENVKNYQFNSDINITSCFIRISLPLANLQH